MLHNFIRLQIPKTCMVMSHHSHQRWQREKYLEAVILCYFFSSLLPCEVELNVSFSEEMIKKPRGIRISKKGMIATTCCHKQITSLIQSRILSDPDFVDGRSLI